MSGVQKKAKLNSYCFIFFEGQGVRGWLNETQLKAQLGTQQWNNNWVYVFDTTPVHQMNTFNAVIHRCQFVLKHLGPKYMVLTVEHFLLGYSRRSAPRSFRVKGRLLNWLDEGDLTLVNVNVEVFVCRIYGLSDVSSEDKTMSVLFRRYVKPEPLPLTLDALYYHIQRCHYQVMIWLQAHLLQGYTTTCCLGLKHNQLDYGR